MSDLLIHHINVFYVKKISKQKTFHVQIKEQAKHVVEEEAKLLAPLEQVRFTSFRLSPH